MISRELFDTYDVLLFDLFGVIWNGVDWIDGTLDTLKYLIKRGKILIILSNASVPTKVLIERYSHNGPQIGVHFSELVTSGEVLNRILRNHQLKFKNVPHPKKYAVLGTYASHNFEDSGYEHTDSLDEADFVYISIPQFTNEQKSLMPNEMQKFLRMSNMRSLHETVWDSLSVKPFIPQLEEFLSKNKPILIANPDKFASVGVLKPGSSDEYVTQLVVRQGSLGEEYIKLGGEVCFVGKPYPMVYEYALQLAADRLKISFADLKNVRIAMVGDTLETDILGARNASGEFGIRVDGILTDTGISHQKIGNVSVESRKRYYDLHGIIPTHEISTVAQNGEVLF